MCPTLCRSGKKQGAEGDTQPDTLLDIGRDKTVRKSQGKDKVSGWQLWSMLWLQWRGEGVVLFKDQTNRK